MLRSPYRSAVRGASRMLELGDLDLLVVFAVLWVVCASEVVTRLARHGVFGTEETLALIVVFVLPWLVLDSRRRSQEAPK